MQEGIHLGGKWGRFVRDKFLVLTTFTNHFTLRLILRFYIHIIEEMSITHMQSLKTMHSPGYVGSTNTEVFICI